MSASGLKVSPSQSSSTKNPWGSPQQRPVHSLSDVIDEEYAQQIQNQEEYPVVSTTNLVAGNEIIHDISANLMDDAVEDSTVNDMLLAQMLQLEFDKENDAYIKAQEHHTNGSNKVKLSYKNFCLTHPYNENDDARKPMQHYNDWIKSDEGEEDEDDDESFYYMDEGREESCSQVTSKRRAGPGKEIITKHDAQICSKKNAENVERFPPSFCAGDITDIRLSNQVYNRLKLHSMKEEKHSMKVHEKKEHATHEHALDENTRLILYKMVNNGMLDSLSGIISTGKEAVVIHAKGGEIDDGPLPAECALKVFKTTLSEFKTRERYIKDDHRFRDRFQKQNPRKIIKLWAEKEFRNLKRMFDAGIQCPEPICLRKQILLMSFVGTDQCAAPKLKDAVLSRSQYKKALEEIVKTMRTMYKECNLIHADLSEYNILWHREMCWFIDVSQSIEPAHPHAFRFLLRDCQNIVNFFRNIAGLTDVMSAEELFTHVCEKEIKGDALDVIEGEVREFERNEEFLTHGIDTKPYSFDHFFEKSVNGELADPYPERDELRKPQKSPSSTRKSPHLHRKGPKSPKSVRKDSKECKIDQDEDDPAS